MKKLAILLALVVFQKSFSQDYLPLNGNSYFKVGNFDGAYSIFPDSVINNGAETTIYFNSICKSCSDSNANCLESNCVDNFLIEYSKNINTNILGEKCIIDSEGILHFHHQNAISILKTRANINDTWQFRNDTNITCTLVNKDIESFLGVSDSVITYNLSNGIVIKLSKNYGFVLAIDFGDLSSTVNYEIDANSSINTDEIINFCSVFDQNAGDTIVYSHSYSVFNGPNTRFENGYIRKSFKNRIINSDSSAITLVYDHEEYTKIVDFNGGNATIYDTIYTVYLNKTTTYNLAEYVFLNNPVKTTHNEYVNINKTFNQDFNKYQTSVLRYSFDECSQQPYNAIDHAPLGLFYSNKLGLTRYDAQGYLPENTGNEIIISYKVGNETFGDLSFFTHY
jgi:hypothetical protein